MNDFMSRTIIKCSICGQKDKYPVLEIINVTRGGEVVGIICSDCELKYKINGSEEEI